MFETHKIDSFFSGEKNLLDEQEKIFISRRTKVVRFLKLFLPCLTALLLGLGVALFDFEAASDSSISLADEEKIYFEKFRMQNTSFEIIEKDNQVSTLKADIVEEINPGEKIYSLKNPNAQTLDNGKVITLVAKEGTYNQNNRVLDLKTDVVANYNNVMDIKTASASYNFAEENGYGNEEIIGDGEKGSFRSDKFTFDKKNDITTLIGHVYAKSGELELRSPDKVTLYGMENKLVAPNGTATKEKDTIKGDTLTVFFKDMKSFEIAKLISVGHTEVTSDDKKAFADRGEYLAETGNINLYNNVKIVDKTGYTATSDAGVYDSVKKTFTLSKNVKITKGANTITAPKAIYFQNKNEFRFYDNVLVEQEGCTASAQSGVYYIKKNIAELENNVVITKNGNMVKGDKAISDFNSSVSRLIAKNGGRISGKLNEGSLQKKKDGADD